MLLQNVGILILIVLSSGFTMFTRF